MVLAYLFESSKRDALVMVLLRIYDYLWLGIGISNSEDMKVTTMYLSFQKSFYVSLFYSYTR